jgi:hypothetical protein
MVDCRVETAFVAFTVSDVALMDATPDAVNDFIPDPNDLFADEPAVSG